MKKMFAMLLALTLCAVLMTGLSTRACASVIPEFLNLTLSYDDKTDKVSYTGTENFPEGTKFEITIFQRNPDSANVLTKSFFAPDSSFELNRDTSSYYTLLVKAYYPDKTPRDAGNFYILPQSDESLHIVYSSGKISILGTEHIPEGAEYTLKIEIKDEKGLINENRIPVTKNTTEIDEDSILGEYPSWYKNLVFILSIEDESNCISNVLELDRSVIGNTIQNLELGAAENAGIFTWDGFESTSVSEEQVYYKINVFKDEELFKSFIRKALSVDIFSILHRELEGEANYSISVQAVVSEGTATSLHGGHFVNGYGVSVNPVLRVLTEETMSDRFTLTSLDLKSGTLQVRPNSKGTVLDAVNFTGYAQDREMYETTIFNVLNSSGAVIDAIYAGRTTLSQLCAMENAAALQLNEAVIQTQNGGAHSPSSNQGRVNIVRLPAIYSVNIDPSIVHGTVTADKETAIENEIVTLTITPEDEYELDTLTVMRGETEITISDTGNSRTFTMPADDVTVSAAFTHVACGEHIARVPGQAATCTDDGWQDYHQCSVCGRMYADADCAREITDLEAWKSGDGKIAAGHSPTYAADKNVITESCSACPAILGNVTILAEDATYNGAPYEEDAHITVTATGTLKDRNWPISYIATSGSLTAGKPVHAGAYVAAISMEKNGTSLSAGDDFAIIPVSIENAVVTVTDTCTYDGAEKKPTSLTVTLNGHLQAGTDFEIVGYSNNINAGTNTAQITIRGKGNYTGEATGCFTIAKAAPTAADFTFAPPANLIYDGNEKAASITTNKSGMGAISIIYFHNGGDAEHAVSPRDADEYLVAIYVAEGENYLAASSLRADDWKFTIAQTQTAMTAKTDKTAYTYGDIITVTGTADVPQPEQQSFNLLRAFAGPSTRQVALYDVGGYQLTDGVDVVNSEYTLTYDTKGKGVLPGEDILLRVWFVGDSNLSDQTVPTNAFSLSAKSLTPSLSGSAARIYDGTTEIPAGHGLNIQLDGLQGSDSVSVAGSFAYADASAGTGKTVTASGIALGGDDAKFYTLSVDTASSACGEIAKAQTIPMNGTLHITNNYAQTYEIDLSQCLPALDGGRTFGDVSYALDGVGLGSYYSGGAAISGSMLSLPISAVDSDEEKPIGAVTVTVSSQNVADSTLTISVSTVNHQHHWNFTASGDTITATCSDEDGACAVLQVTIQLVSPTDAALAYTGTAKTVTIKQTPEGMFGDLPAVRYCHADGCIGVGEHTATLTYHGATAEKKFSIGPVDTAGAGGDAEIVEGTTLIVTKDTELPASAAYYGEKAKTALEAKFGATNTVARIEVHMQEAGEAALAAMGNVNTGTAMTKVLEISLKYWDEPSGKWVKITEDTLNLVPRHGVEVVIPYSLFGFTDVDNCEQYRFVVQHMITLPMDDVYQIGDIEDLSGETVATAEGLKIHVEHGFSPFVVGYAKVVDQAAIGALPQTGDRTQLGVWLAMLALCGAGMLTLRSRKRRAE